MPTTPTPSLALRLILQYIADTGEAPSKEIDTQASPTPLVLDSFTDITPGRKLKLSPSAEDQPLSFTSAAVLVIFSHDYPFGFRLAEGSPLIQNQRLVQFAVDDVANAGVAGPVYLTGNGQNQADLEIWIVETLD
jgi:hypothetical protein